MSLVYFVARRFKGREQMEDVIQVGMIGLIKAIDRFDLFRENEFTTFAVPYIVGEIKRYFRDSTWTVHVPRPCRNYASNSPRPGTVCNPPGPRTDRRGTLRAPAPPRGGGPR